MLVSRGGGVRGIDSRDFGSQVALWIGGFFQVKWSREVSSRARTVILFEAAPDAATVRLTTTIEHGFTVESNGGFRVDGRLVDGSMAERVEIVRRPIFDIASSGLVVVQRGSPPTSIVGPAQSAPIEKALDFEGGEIVEHWWGWPPK